MEMKMYFNAKEMLAVKKLMESFGQTFAREDQYEVDGPIRFSVNHVDGEAIVTIASNDNFFCDVLGIFSRNAGLIKNVIGVGKSLFELCKSTVNILEGELDTVCKKYRTPVKDEHIKPYGSFTTEPVIDKEAA